MIRADTDDRIYSAWIAEFLRRLSSPEWGNHGPGDPGRTLVEIFAFLSESLLKGASALSDRAFLDLAKLLGMAPKRAVPAKAKLRFRPNRNAEPDTVIKPGVLVSTADGRIVFETTENIVIKRARDGSLGSNLVSATEGQTVSNEELAIGDATTRQSFKLQHGPVLMCGALAIELRVNERGKRHRWTWVPSLTLAGPKSRHYVLDTESGRITFGDGKKGRLPEVGASITVSYRIGGGLRGNLPSGYLNRLVKPIDGMSAVTNPVAARGGADAESVEAFRRRVPTELALRSEWCRTATGSRGCS